MRLRIGGCPLVVVSALSNRVPIGEHVGPHWMWRPDLTRDTPYRRPGLLAACGFSRARAVSAGAATIGRWRTPLTSRPCSRPAPRSTRGGPAASFDISQTEAKSPPVRGWTVGLGVGVERADEVPAGVDRPTAPP
jgi:hypothetical protein